MKSMVSKIISGGQTGSDKGGLLAGRELGIPTGGTAPKGWKTENGADTTLESFGLHQSQFTDYRVRTRRNVENSHLSIIIAFDPKSVGTKLTIDACNKLHKPYVLIDPKTEGSVAKIQDIIKKTAEALNGPVCINIAGNRESKAPGIEAFTVELLKRALS